MRAGIVASLVVAGSSLGAQAQAQTQDASLAPKEPLWELRLAASTLYASAYPGSDEMKLRGIGAPLFIYRGDRIRFGEYGVARAIAASTPTLELDISADAIYAADKVRAREGMPDLDYLLQIGPQVVWHINDTGWTANGRSEITAFAPVRGVASTDFSSINHVGWLAEPSIMYRRQFGGKLRESFTAQVTAHFADEGLMDYWYGVAPIYATPTRPAYRAEGGYLSTGLKLNWTRELTDDLHIYLTYDGRVFSGTKNADSPLFKRDITHAISFSFVWKMLKSDQPAKTDNM